VRDLKIWSVLKFALTTTAKNFASRFVTEAQIESVAETA
jgi:hypothetical protein